MWLKDSLNMFILSDEALAWRAVFHLVSDSNQQSRTNYHPWRPYGKDINGYYNNLSMFETWHCTLWRWTLPHLFFFFFFFQRKYQATFRATKMYLCRNSHRRKQAHGLATMYAINASLNESSQEIECYFRPLLIYICFKLHISTLLTSRNAVHKL